jgi:hypothetical protein
MLQKSGARLALLAVPDDWFMVAVEAGIETARGQVINQGFDAMDSVIDDGRPARWANRLLEKNRCGCVVDDNGRLRWMSSALVHRPLTAPEGWEDIDRDLAGLKDLLARAHRSNEFKGSARSATRS